MRLQVYGWPKADMSGVATTQDEMKQALREMRDVLLRECDWTMLPDCQLSEETVDQWRLWRQYMRDLPSLVSDPITYTVEFNDPPEDGRPKSWDFWDLDRGADPYGTGQIQG